MPFRVLSAFSNVAVGNEPVAKMPKAVIEQPPFMTYAAPQSQVGPPDLFVMELKRLARRRKILKPTLCPRASVLTLP
jgi:hypothetical protein